MKFPIITYIFDEPHVTLPNLDITKNKPNSDLSVDMYKTGFFVDYENLKKQILTKTKKFLGCYKLEAEFEKESFSIVKSPKYGLIDRFYILCSQTKSHS